MAVKKKANAPIAPAAPVTKATVSETKLNKADAIRAYFDAHTDSKPADIAEALSKEHEIEFTAGHVSSVLSRHRNGNSNSSNGKIDPELIKSAAAFVAVHGDIDKALDALNQVGEFIDNCGNSKNAKAALETYQSLAAVFSK